MMAGEELSKRMQCELTTPIYYIERVRKMDGVPMAIEYTYYNKDLVPSLDRRIASQSIYSYIKNDLKRQHAVRNNPDYIFAVFRNDNKLIGIN